MPFNSFEFLLAFLPLTLLCVFTAVALSKARAVVSILIVASLVFYAYSSVFYLALFALLMVVNYALGCGIAAAPALHHRRILLAVGCAINVSFLVYFKYRLFAASIVNDLFDLRLTPEKFVIPLGISFFIFQKIAFLADIYRGHIKRIDFQGYVLFVAFFPQLIAGPIVHYGDMQPQFDRMPWMSLTGADVVTGISFITIGLFKKVVLADNISPYADTLFNAAASGTNPGFADAWIGCTAFALQIYFDFSGYSDMALGLAALFGIRLPVNFFSPYKSLSIIEFWRRWHITLSQFLRDYLYIPLGGNRKGRTRRYLNLLMTMALGGLWHGAAWTFLAWGVLHGLLLGINHLWRDLCSKLPPLARFSDRPAMTPVWWALTFVAVNLAWCLFRAPSFVAALKVSGAMLYATPGATAIFGWKEAAVMAAGVAWVAALPSSQELVERIVRSDDRRLLPLGAGQGLVFLSALYFMMVHQYEKFIYFMF